MQILYNAAQGRYVLLFHADTASFDYNVVGVAVSASNITGPYTFVRTFHPDGLNSLDMGVFQVCLAPDPGLSWRLSANQKQSCSCVSSTPLLHDNSIAQPHPGMILMLALQQPG